MLDFTIHLDYYMLSIDFYHMQVHTKIPQSNEKCSIVAGGKKQSLFFFSSGQYRAFLAFGGGGGGGKLCNWLIPC